MDLGKTRWLMFEQSTISVSMPLLIVLVLWLTVIFISFGLFAPLNATVVASLFVSALSVSGAIFLILEMYEPYSGLIQISSAPLRAALGESWRDGRTECRIIGCRGEESHVTHHFFTGGQQRKRSF